MKNALFSQAKKLLLIFTIVFSFSICAYSEKPEKIETGLLDIDVSQMSEQYRVRFANHLKSELEATGVFKIIGRDVMLSSLESKGLSFPEKNYATNNIAIEIGRLMHIPHMITGGLFRTASSYSVTLRLVDVSTGIVLEAITVDNLSPLASSIEEALGEAAYSLALAVSGPLEGEKYMDGPLPGMEFAVLKGGEFWRGSLIGEKNEKPIKIVKVDAFQMMITEVTQAQWSELMGKNPSKHKGENNPVERVSYKDVLEFIVLMNIKDDEYLYRLPSEAEWEYACRAGKKTEYIFGDEAMGLQHFAWYEDNAKKKTHPVGEKEPNEWGIHDMMGNVYEFCADHYYKDYENAALDGRAYVDRRNPDEDRVVRGGCYLSKEEYCRSASRRGYKVDKKTHYVGFRLVRVPKPE